MTNKAKAGFKPINFFISALTVVLALALVMVLILWVQNRPHTVEMLLRDPAQEHNFWPFSGIISFFGILSMWAAASICIFVASLMRRERWLLLLFGLFTVMLVFDDLFMLHEYFWPGRGVPTKIAQLGYGLIGCSLLLMFRSKLLGRQHVGLYLSLGLVGTSLFLDLVVPYSVPQLIVEDSTKFAGFVLWSGYWISRAAQTVREARTVSEPALAETGSMQAQTIADSPD